MKIFVIGNDRSIFNENSHLLERAFEYSKIVDKYLVVVPHSKRTKINRENLFICGFGGVNKFFQIINLFIGSFKILKKEKFDVISVQDQYYLAFVTFLLSKFFRVGLEIQIHGFEKYFGIRKTLANFLISRANSIRVVSNRLKIEIVQKFRVSEDKITVAPIYTKVEGYEVECYKEKSDKFIFLTIGRLVKIKNIELQIKSIKNLISKYNNIELHIVGDGEERQNLKKLVKNLNLENCVKFFGYQETLEKFYNNSDAFLLTSNYEGWGLVIIEALKYKLPIIMTDVGCAGEVVVDNENALIIPANNQEALENAMSQIYENQELRQKFSNNSTAAIEKLKTKEQILDLYKKSWEVAKKKIRLLILTQKVDKNDWTLGFFHNWIIEFAKHCEKITVICLYKGEFDLSDNIKVLSLGKENKKSKIKYLYNFYKYVILERKNYDSVFVHMNPEYVVLGGILWSIMNKKIYLWYSHKSVNTYLKIANFFVRRIFTNSAQSCGLNSKKISIMKHGIDISIFKNINVTKNENLYKILYVGRISPIKNLELLIDSFYVLKHKFTQDNINLTIVGDIVYDSDGEYLSKIEEKINEYKLGDYIEFFGNCSIDNMSKIYNEHNLSINLSPTGGVDKTVLESILCGVPCIVFNKSFKEIFDGYNFFILNNLDSEELASKIYEAYKNDSLKNISELSDRVRRDYNLNNLVLNILDKINFYE